MRKQILRVTVQVIDEDTWKENQPKPHDEWADGSLSWACDVLRSMQRGNPALNDNVHLFFLPPQVKQ